MQPTERQLGILEARGHLLVAGGPGSGKTTVAILKAARLAERELSSGQRILFLSFARATVSRVIEAVRYEREVPFDLRRRIVVETYHAFFWRLLRTHGYLVGLPRKLEILPSPAEAIALSAIRANYARDANLSDAGKRAKKERECIELSRLAREEGRVCFGLFAPFAGEILHGSERIRRLVATMYPTVVLDEFQDTNAEQWQVVRELGTFATLIALADPLQRIYGHLGADPARLDHFRDAFGPLEFDLGAENHRSAGTDILAFGDDLLTGVFRQSAYDGVDLCCYEPFGKQPMTQLVTATYASRKRLIAASREDGRKDWSLAILVPTKRMTRLVSDAFRTPPAKMTAIRHNAIVDIEAVILAAETIAFLLQPDGDGRSFEGLLERLQDFFLGKGGDEPTKKDLAEAGRIRKAGVDWFRRRADGESMRSNSILVRTLAAYEKVRALTLVGDPEEDWRVVRRLLESGDCRRLREVAAEARNIRLLDRGTQLRQALAQDWRDNGAYANALKITRQAFMLEHFATAGKPEAGVVVMNMHKAKGKQFDEVILFEGWPRSRRGRIIANFDRIIRGNATKEIDDQVRQNLRVSVTRARQRTTILTPRNDPCRLLPPRRC